MGPPAVGGADQGHRRPGSVRCSGHIRCTLPACVCADRRSGGCGHHSVRDRRVSCCSPRAGLQRAHRASVPALRRPAHEAGRGREPGDARDREFRDALAREAHDVPDRARQASVYWSDRAYAALKDCDFRTALAASTLGIRARRNCDEGPFWPTGWRRPTTAACRNRTSPSTRSTAAAASPAQ